MKTKAYRIADALNVPLVGGAVRVLEFGRLQEVQAQVHLAAFERKGRVKK